MKKAVNRMPMGYIFKHIGICAGLLVSATIVAVLSLCVVQGMVGSAGFVRETRKASELFMQVWEEAQTQRPALIKELNATRIDYYSEAHMYQLSLGNPHATFFRNALAPQAFFDPGRVDSNGFNNQITGLAARLDGATPLADNARYWNGFMIPLRTLGSIISYQGLLILNAVILISLIGWCSVVLYRLFDKKIAIVFVSTLFMMWTWVNFFGINYISNYFVMLTGVLATGWLVHKNRLLDWGAECFLIIGIATAFFDLLIAPLMTLGFPLIVAVLYLLNSNIAPNANRIWRYAFAWTVAWLGGYVMFWGFKLILAPIIFDSFIGTDAAGRIVEYSLGLGGISGYVREIAVAFASNIATMFGWSGYTAHAALGSAGLFAAIGTILMIAPVAWVLWQAHKTSHASLAAPSALLGIALLPVLRLMIVPYHSAENAFFTFREFGVTVFALSVFCMYVYEHLQKASD